MSYVNIQTRRLPFGVSYLRDLYRFRHLAFNLVSSDIRSRFRRSKLGILWAIIQPLGYSLIIAWAWGSLFKYESYWSFALYVYSGMIVWEYFTTCTSGSLQALIAAGGYLRQARVPLVVFQIRMPLTAMVIALYASIGLLIMMIATGEAPNLGLHLLLVPASFAVLFVFTTPIAITMSVLGSQFRDLPHIIGLVLQALFFLSPVMLTRDVLDGLPILQYVNPLVPLLHMFRAPLFDNTMWDPMHVMVLGAWTAGLWLLAILTSASFGRKIIFYL
jgi:lipopolysaccharide transport system permease protein